MQLPDPGRVIYKRNPLIEVVSQLRFPRILKISNQDPVEFQDKIRADYPILEIENTVVVVDVGSEQAPDSQKLSTVYHFRSEDLEWQISLNRDFLALTTKNYQKYEDFKRRFREIIGIFEEIYKPSFYTRIGLRYQDLIIRSSLGLAEEPWSELIPNHIAPELHSPEIVDVVMASTKTLVMKIDSGQVAFRHGLVEARDTEQSSIEPAYLLDVDFFSEERVAVGSHVWKHLDEYNQSARKLFRWSIKEKLHLAMEPQPAESVVTSDQ